MKRLLITGATGMLGACLARRWKDTFEIYATGLRKTPEANYAFSNYRSFDLANSDYRSLIQWSQPDFIIHCAALTDADYCEKHPNEAMEINGESVSKFLLAAPHARLVFISSDAVYGQKTAPFSEKNETSPCNVYGRSKLLGEKYLTETFGNRHCIVRTTLIGKAETPEHQSLTEWIVGSLKKGKAITLFDDVYFTPISIWHVAEALDWLLTQHSFPQVLNIAGKERITKYQFGMGLARSLSLNTNLIKKGVLQDGVLQAARVSDQSLDSTLFETLSNLSAPTVADSIDVLFEHFEMGQVKNA